MSGDDEALNNVRKSMVETMEALEKELIELKENNDSADAASVEKQISLLDRAIDIVTDVVIDCNVDQKAMIDAALRLAIKR